MSEDNLPYDLGYRMPAEWERHEATWIAWPKNPDSFPAEILPKVENAYIKIIEELKKSEKVNILVDDMQAEKAVKGFLKAKGVSASNLALHRIPTSDVWFRDYGPIFITRKDPPKALAYTKWVFNAWGSKYDDLKRDSEVPERMPIKDITKFEAQMVLEGGSIDTNGLGTFITTEQCLLNRNRNPTLNRPGIESRLRNYLGATNIIWLKDGIIGDDTDGHVDDIARFVNSNTIVCATESDKSDANYAALADNLSALKRAKDHSGVKLNVVQLPMPKAVVYNGLRLPASYANFYIANGVVLVPVFNDANDAKALRILSSLFPGRRVVGIDCRALVYGFGAIHCITQQQPSII